MECDECRKMGKKKIAVKDFSLTHRFLLNFHFIAGILVGDFVLSRGRDGGALHPSSGENQEEGQR